MKRLHLVTNNPNRTPFGHNPNILFWLDSDGGEGRTHASAQDAADYVERHYPGEEVEWDVIPPEKRRP